MSPRATAGQAVLPNIQVSNGAQPVNSPSIAVNPTNPANRVMGATDYNCASRLGTYASNNGGQTWSHGCISVVGRGGCGEASVRFGPDGTAYLTGIGNCDGYTGSAIFSKSTDGGVTWSPPVVAVPPVVAGGITDVVRLSVDNSPASPFFRRMYISATQFDARRSSQISLSRSIDGGSTWSTAVPVEKRVRFPSIDNFSSVAVLDDGTVAVMWMRCTAGGATQDCGAATVTYLASFSHDGGNTFSPPETIGQAQLPPDECSCQFYGTIPGTDEPKIPDLNGTCGGTKCWGDFEGFLLDAERPAGLVDSIMEWNEGTNTWSSIYALHPGGPVLSWSAFDAASRRLAVVWLSYKATGCTRCYDSYGVIRKANGTFTGFRQLSNVTSDSVNDGFGGHAFGLNIGAAWSGGSLIVVWMDTRNNVNTQVFEGGIAP
jgi:hypothetical protein